MRSGSFPAPLPAVFGWEAAGSIVALPTDPAVLNHAEYKKRGYAIGAKAIAVRVIIKLSGFVQVISPQQMVNGTDAEYIAAPWDSIFPIPPDSGIDTRTGAAGFLQAATVISLMEEAYHVKKGDTVFIHTIAGGAGLLAAQYAKWKGATVIGTTSKDEKAKLAMKYGADHVIVYTREDTVKRVLELTNGVGVDAVFDGVGKDTYVSIPRFIPSRVYRPLVFFRFDSNFIILKKKGTLVAIGNASGDIPPFSISKLTDKNITLIRPSLLCYMSTPEEGTHYSRLFFDALSKGVLKVNVFHEYPFTAEGVQQAQTDLVGGKSAGKLIIKIDD